MQCQSHNQRSKMFAERSSFFIYSFEGGGVIQDGELGPS